MPSAHLLLTALLATHKANGQMRFHMVGKVSFPKSHEIGKITALSSIVIEIFLHFSGGKG